MAKMDKNGDGEVLREHVLQSIKKYKAMLQESEELSAMFKRHDKDMSGGLDQAQVLTMLQEVGRLEKLSFVPRMSFSLPRAVERGVHICGLPDMPPACGMASDAVAR